MNNFKKIFAIVFTVAVAVFGVLVMIDEREIFEALTKLSFNEPLERAGSVLTILVLIVDIFLIALPFAAFLLVLMDKFDPFKAITDCALVVLFRFITEIFAFVIIVLSASPDAQTAGEVLKEFLFNPDTLGIIPLIVFIAAVVFLMLAKVSNYQGTIIRAVFATIGAGLAIFGLVFYFICGGANSFLGGMGKDPDWLTIMGLVVGIACFGGLVAYSYLPQTREFAVQKEEEPAEQE